MQLSIKSSIFKAQAAVGLLLTIFFLSQSLVFAKDDKWNISKSTHFIIHYKNAPEYFINNLIVSSEKYYDGIANDLGFRRYNFWLWENRANIYIYDKAEDYQAATGEPVWSSGCAQLQNKEIISYAYAQDFFNTILPHEMGHIIFREFVGFDNRAIPLWLDEAVASYQEDLKRSVASSLVKKSISDGNFMSLEYLSHLNLQSLSDNASVALYYSEALSVLDYLVKQFGSDNFISFCQNIRDKKDLNTALRLVYGFSNIQELEQSWKKKLLEE